MGASYIELYNQRHALQVRVDELSGTQDPVILEQIRLAHTVINRLTERIDALQGTPGGYRVGGMQSRIDFVRLANAEKRKRRLY